MIMLILAAITMAFTIQSFSGQQEPEPWSEDQLMEPAKLAKILNDSSKQDWPLIIAVNPDGMYGLPLEGGIKGSKWFGAVEKKENLKKLESFLKEVEKDEEIVLYCGCCPFHMCPNIRPAFSLLNEMKFTQHKLLNMPKNIKENWIDKGYPMKN